MVSKINKIVTILLVPVLSTASTLDPRNNENIEIVLNGSGTGCYVGEPYWLDVLVINISNDTLTIDYPSPEDDLMHFDGSFHDTPLHIATLLR